MSLTLIQVWKNIYILYTYNIYNDNIMITTWAYTHCLQNGFLFAITCMIFKSKKKKLYPSPWYAYADTVCVTFCTKIDWKPKCTGTHKSKTVSERKKRLILLLNFVYLLCFFLFLFLFFFIFTLLKLKCLTLHP